MKHHGASSQTYRSGAGLFFVLTLGCSTMSGGWRGYALDLLQSCHPALAASLVLGLIWAVWHVPLFFIPGAYQNAVGAGSFRAGTYFVALLPLPVLMTWIYNSTDRSTLSAILVHFSVNLTGEFVEKTDRVALLELLSLSAAAAVVTFRCGSRRLS